MSFFGSLFGQVQRLLGRTPGRVQLLLQKIQLLAQQTILTSQLRNSWIFCPAPFSSIGPDSFQGHPLGVGEVLRRA